MIRRVVAAGLLMAALPAVVVVPADAAGTVQYDVLGDSYAAGYGVPPYDESGCRRSASSYGVLLDGRDGLELDDLVACSAASATSMVDGGQLTALDAETDLVLLSMGANDVGWAQPAVACLLRTDAECKDKLATLRARIANDLPGVLDGLYAQIRAAAPDAGVLVTGYPRWFSPRYGVYLNASTVEQRRLNDANDLLDQVIRAATERAGFGFVDVTTRFLGHGMNAPLPWIFGLRLPSGEIDKRAFHPDARGYEAYARLISAAFLDGLAG